MTFMPAFHYCPKEGAIIGRLLAGYGELEFEMCHCLANVLGGMALAIPTLFKDRGEDQRIKTAAKTLKPHFQKLNLKSDVDEAFIAIRWCRKTRNIFAHAHWSQNFEHPSSLFYVSTEEAATANPLPAELTPYLLDLTLLERIETYFEYTGEWFRYLNHQTLYKTEKIKNLPPPAPQKMRQPPRHSPLGKRQPPQLIPIL